ncbi:UNVERIFIED_CONTAM: putative beta-D-xylosidase 7 [Sesamum radiatum]|uniref:Beta-D-xylosidase 7 n=1 Tax=Sesamum radiatum TaxID=300843 RepID=A0AAW2Q1P6_SESRA
MELHLHTATLFTLLLTATQLLRADTTQPPFSCDSSDPRTHSFPFCRAALPIHQRARDLVSRLTLDEKISQLVNSAPAIPRLGVPAYEWWSEALHGVSGYGRGISFGGRIAGATSFPQVILSASTFDSHLWYRIGQAIGKEARGVYNEGQAKGMTFWAPNINIYRDPRWGRGQETPGEDPLVAGRYAVAYVRGIQGTGTVAGRPVTFRPLPAANTSLPMIWTTGRALIASALMLRLVFKLISCRCTSFLCLYNK